MDLQSRAIRLPRASELSDDELVERIRAGEEQLFAVLMRRTNQRLFRVARSMLLDDDDAEDVVQEAHVAAYLNLASYRGPSAYGAWVTRIAVREAYRRLRKRDRLQEDRTGLEQVVDPRPAPDSTAGSRELVKLLERAIDDLDPPYRVVLMMRDVEKMNTRQTADALELSEENVRVRLHRARGILRASLSNKLGDEGLFPFLGLRCDRIVQRVAERLWPNL